MSKTVKTQAPSGVAQSPAKRSSARPSSVGRSSVEPPSARPLFSGRVKSEEAGERLDLWLRRKNSQWSRKKIKQYLDAHCVAVNGKTVYMASWALRANDEVLVFVEKMEKSQFVKILYEDRFLLAVDKDPYRSFEETIGEINAYLKRKGGPNYHAYVGMMHRLDRHTSGVLIVTKDKRANVLSEQFRNHTLRKVYWAVVHGSVPFFEKEVRAVLQKGEWKGGRKVKVRGEGAHDGKFSKSSIRVLERYRAATLLEVMPQTGRTHQIRAHLSALGYPILGDRVYGNQATAEIPFSRHALHAHCVRFKHPVSGDKLTITAPLPKDMQGLLDRLRQ